MHSTRMHACQPRCKLGQSATLYRYHIGNADDQFESYLLGCLRVAETLHRLASAVYSLQARLHKPQLRLLNRMSPEGSPPGVRLRVVAKVATGGWGLGRSGTGPS